MAGTGGRCHSLISSRSLQVNVRGANGKVIELCPEKNGLPIVDDPCGVGIGAGIGFLACAAREEDQGTQLSRARDLACEKKSKRGKRRERVLLMSEPRISQMTGAMQKMQAFIRQIL